MSETQAPPPGAGKISEGLPFQPLNIAVMTVSDTRDEENDTSGHFLAERVTRDGQQTGGPRPGEGQKADIQAQVQDWVADPAIDVVISTGGTGLTGRDVTPERSGHCSTRPSTAFQPICHMVSFQSVGLSTIQSRASAGLVGGILIFACPAQMGREGRLGQGDSHQLDSRLKPCNLVEVMPRLIESDGRTLATRHGRRRPHGRCLRQAGHRARGRGRGPGAHGARDPGNWRCPAVARRARSSPRPKSPG